MKQEISKLYKLESQVYELQNSILKEFIKKAENKAILEFLEELSDNQNDTLNFTGLLSEINELKLYKLKIGSKVPKGFDDIFMYHYSTDYDEDGFCKLFFEINDDNIIEDIEYEA